MINETKFTTLQESLALFQPFGAFHLECVVFLWSVMTKRVINKYPCIEDLTGLFRYEDGVLFWIKTRRIDLIGKVAGCQKTDSGYWVINISNVLYRRSRLIWIYHNGDIPEGLFVDHINMVRNDDRIENLRLASNGQNTANSFRSDQSPLGRGIVAYKTSGGLMYWVHAQSNGIKLYKGRIKTLDEAKKTSSLFMNELHGEFVPNKGE